MWILNLYSAISWSISIHHSLGSTVYPTGRMPLLTLATVAHELCWTTQPACTHQLISSQSSCPSMSVSEWVRYNVRSTHYTSFRRRCPSMPLRSSSRPWLQVPYCIWQLCFRVTVPNVWNKLLVNVLAANTDICLLVSTVTSWNCNVHGDHTPDTLKFPDISLTMCGTHAHVKWYAYSMPVVLVTRDSCTGRYCWERVLAMAILSVCLSVCLSQPGTEPSPGEIDSGSSPYGSLEYLVSYEVIWCQWVKRVPSNGGIKEGYPP